VIRRFGCLCLLLVCAATASAKALTPMEKALQALAAKRQSATPTPAATFSPTPTATPQGPAVPQPAGQQTPEPPPAVGILQEPAGNTPAAWNPLGSTPVAAAGVSPTASATSAPAVQVDILGLTLNAATDLIVVSWSNTVTTWHDFAGYQILRAHAGQDLEPLLGKPTLYTSYQDVSVTAGTDYAYQVVAVTAAGNTLARSARLEQRPLPPRPPGVPNELSVSTEEERAYLTWKPPVQTSYAIAGYLVYRAPGPKAPSRLLPGPLVAKTSYYDDTGKYDTEYEYRVAAVDAKGVTGEACGGVLGRSRSRSRNGLVLMSTAYRGLGRRDGGLNADLQFTYFIGTLYGEQDKSLSSQALYLDPISAWILTADAKYTLLTEPRLPVSAAVGGKGSILLFAGQQSTSGGSFTFSEKSSFQTLWGGYASLSHSFGDWGVHGGYQLGTAGQVVHYLSKFLEPENARNLFFAGMDFPIARRMNAALEILYPLDQNLQSRQHPVLVNAHVDRLFNFDIAYLHWDQGWALLGYFNLRFTVFPGEDR